ncbi:hypothetical protein AR456_16995 [Halomonas huangheensis]|nr:hypothetical protein AR456_16995 [Halomonas huangheensis]
MRSLVIIVVGVVVVWLLVSYLPLAWRRKAMWAFSLVWVLLCAWNLNIGLSHGYALGEELLMHAFLFGIPVVFGWWRVIRQTGEV